MSFVTCSVDGCNKKLQPLLKPDPRDRATWVYPECDVCFKPCCDRHSSEIDGQLDGQLVCDRCRRAAEAPDLLDLGILPPRLT